jgi:nucleoid DNA-binding protein
MTASTTAKKPSTTAKAAPKVAKSAVAAKPAAVKPAVPTPKVPAAKPVVASAMADKAKGATLKMKDLIEQVTEASGGKKRGVKEVVEATLAALGAALSRGDAINLPGFGRAKVAHAEDKGAGKPMTIKLKTQSPGAAKKPGKQGLADTEDEG